MLQSMGWQRVGHNLATEQVQAWKDICDLIHQNKKPGSEVISEVYFEVNQLLLDKTLDPV